MSVVDHEQLLDAIQTRVSYRQFLMTVGALFTLLGGGFVYHATQKWHEAGGEVVVRAARDADHNRHAVEELRQSSRRIESKVDQVVGALNGNASHHPSP